MIPEFREDGYLPDGLHVATEAEDSRDWDDWVEFFSRTREADGRRKGIVEIML